MTDPKLRELLDEYALELFFRHNEVRLAKARLAIEHYVASVRREALEEAAKACEREWKHTAATIIRALKDSKP